MTAPTTVIGSLSFNTTQSSLRQRLETSRSKTRRDIILMKTILLNGKRESPGDVSISQSVFYCNLGFYPQFAIADENNVNRKDSELLFHSKEKQFVSIHPSSIYYYRPELTHLGKGNGCAFASVIVLVVLIRILLGSEGAPMPDELFCFSQLLETHKPFLVNLFRVPTVQSAFITSRSSAPGLVVYLRSWTKSSL